MDTTKVIELIAELKTRGQEWKGLDIKEELPLIENGQKAEFVKDVIAMANNGYTSYLIIGVVDQSFEFKGEINNKHSSDKLNQIISDKIDPPISITYSEHSIDGNEIIAIEITGNNRPYLVARDFKNKITDSKKSAIQKGRIFVRQEDTTIGITRIELEEIFSARKIKLIHSVEYILDKDGNIRINIEFSHKENFAAKNIRVTIEFENAELCSCPSSDNIKHNHFSSDDELKNRKNNIIFDVGLLHKIQKVKIPEMKIRKLDDEWKMKLEITGDNIQHINE